MTLSHPTDFYQSDVEDVLWLQVVRYNLYCVQILPSTFYPGSPVSALCIAETWLRLAPYVKNETQVSFFTYGAPGRTRRPTLIRYAHKSYLPEHLYTRSGKARVNKCFSSPARKQY